MPDNMPDNIGTRPTAAGIALMAKAVAGKQLVFTRGAFGDCLVNNAFVNPSVADQVALTAMIHERLTLPIADISADAGNAVVELLVKNANVTETFQVREVGLYAKDPDTQQEVLYCYIHYGDFGFFVPANTTTIVLEFFYRLTTAIGAATNVTAVIDRSSLYTTLNKFLEHVNSSDPHPNLPPYVLPTGSDTVKGGFKVGANLYVTDDSLNAYDPYDDTAVRNLIKENVQRIDRDMINMSDEMQAYDTSFHRRITELEDNPYVLPTGSDTVKGGFKVGANLYVTGDSLNASAAYDDSALVNRISQLETAIYGSSDTDTYSSAEVWRGLESAETQTFNMPSAASDFNLYGNAKLSGGLITLN